MLKDKVMSIEQVMTYIKEGMTLMIGGFMANGTPETVIDAIIKNNIRNLTVIANDTASIDRGIGKLVSNRNLKKVIVSHIGTNPETGRQMNQKEIEVELIPQGTLIEQIRAGGSGLGGILTPTGIGTVVENGKQKMVIGGKEYLLELPIRADVAIIKGSVIDKAGNVIYKKSTRNFNSLIAAAAEFVIAEADEIVEVGEIDPTCVMTPSILVDAIVMRIPVINKMSVEEKSTS